MYIVYRFHALHQVHEVGDVAITPEVPPAGGVYFGYNFHVIATLEYKQQRE